MSRVGSKSAESAPEVIYELSGREDWYGQRAFPQGEMFDVARDDRVRPTCDRYFYEAPIVGIWQCELKRRRRDVLGNFVEAREHGAAKRRRDCELRARRDLVVFGQDSRVEQEDHGPVEHETERVSRVSTTGEQRRYQHVRIEDDSHPTGCRATLADGALFGPT